MDLIQVLLKQNNELEAVAADSKQKVADSLALVFAMKEESRHKSRLFCFSQVVANFIKIHFRKPLHFPEDFIYKLGDGQDMERREKVRLRGATMGITADNVLEWMLLVEERHDIAHPDTTKADFMAAVQDLIAKRRLSESSAGVFEQVFDVSEAHRIQSEASKQERINKRPKVPFN